jgi:hypothetical protein
LLTVRPGLRLQHYWYNSHGIALRRDVGVICGFQVISVSSASL